MSERSARTTSTVALSPRSGDRLATTAKMKVSF